MKKTASKWMFLLLMAVATTSMFYSCSSTVKDEDIKKAVDEKIASTPEMTGVTATVQDGVVTMAGECKDDQCKAYSESSIKGIKGVKSVVNNATIAQPVVEPAPVVISGDEALKTGAADAIKDYTGVKAEVKDSVIILTGEIKKADLQKLMMSLHALKPKNIDNQLTIK